MHKFIFKLAMCSVAFVAAGIFSASAQTTHKWWEEPDGGGKVELSAGVGDQMFESLVWHQIKNAAGLLPESSTVSSNEDYKYSQHWFGEVRYMFGPAAGVGLMVDYSKVSWVNRQYNGIGELLQENDRDYFSNTAIVVDFSFNYMRRKYFSMHSGLGGGLDINTGTETDYLGRTTEVAPALYLNFWGIRGSYGRFFASFDISGLSALCDSSQIYMFCSRLLNFSIGVKL